MAEKLLDIPKLIEKHEKHENIMVKFRLILEPLIGRIGKFYPSGNDQWQGLNLFEQQQWLNNQSQKNTIIYSTALNSQFFFVRTAANEHLHENRKKHIYDPTNNTLNALFLSLLDIINWFDMFQKQQD